MLEITIRCKILDIIVSETKNIKGYTGDCQKRGSKLRFNVTFTNSSTATCGQKWAKMTYSASQTKGNHTAKARFFHDFFPLSY